MFWQNDNNNNNNFIDCLNIPIDNTSSARLRCFIKTRYISSQLLLLILDKTLDRVMSIRARSKRRLAQP